MSKPKTIWFVSDVPFWERNNGSHLRIAGLSETLIQRGHRLSLWHPSGVSSDMETHLVEQGWEQVLGPATPPGGFWNRAAWSLRGAVNLWRNNMMPRSHSNRPGETQVEVANGLSEPAGRHLSDYRVAAIEQRFLSDLQNAKPDLLFFEYITFSYLAKAAKQKSSCRAQRILDSHDVLHQRCRRMREKGIPHWLQIDRQEETEALQEFDLVLAIQNEERDTFAAMVPQIPVITAGHAIQVHVDEIPSTSGLRANSPMSAGARIGYLAGRGDANLDAIQFFLRECWPTIYRLTDQAAQLLIAGRICARLEATDELPNGVKLCGEQSSLSDWYDSIDLFVNPVRAGAGLKIKNLEALSHGVPVVTTHCGIEGMSAAEGKGCFVAADSEQLTACLVELVMQAGKRVDAAAKARSYIRANHHVDAVFGKLFRFLNC